MSVCSPGHKSLCTPPVIRAESSLIKGQHTERSSLGAFVAKSLCTVHLPPPDAACSRVCKRQPASVSA